MLPGELLHGRHLGQRLPGADLGLGHGERHGPERLLDSPLPPSKARRTGSSSSARNGQQANPWGNGTSYQCVVPPVVRTPTFTAGVGTIGACDGSFALDLNAFWCPTLPERPQKNPGAGAMVQAQLWYRDPRSTSNQTTSLSDAVEFVVGL